MIVACCDALACEQAGRWSYKTRERWMGTGLQQLRFWKVFYRESTINRDRQLTNAQAVTMNTTPCRPTAAITHVHEITKVSACRYDNAQGHLLILLCAVLRACTCVAQIFVTKFRAYRDKSASEVFHSMGSRSKCTSPIPSALYDLHTSVNDEALYKSTFTFTFTTITSR